ncbi:MAG: HNH endonuclease family protein, partial [Prevotella sp.]|nr:HNH endonuclease family protein [Prevotella sp.]
NSLIDIYKLWKGNGVEPLAKNVFHKELDRLIRESIKVADKDELADLTYSDDKTSRLLFLFNVETERRKDEGKRYFPFDKHREGNWSLEHIHAQRSESLKNNKYVYTWLREHLRTLELGQLEGWESLGEELRSFKEDLEQNPESGHVRERFKEIQDKTIEFFTRKEGREGKEEYRDSIANLALLDSAQNTALSNYVFDVKRDIIRSYDREGKYIPFCTKMVFFKYYSPASASLHYWGEEDRKAYLDAIDEVISSFYTSH